MRHRRELICSMLLLSAASFTHGAAFTMNAVDCGGIIGGSLGNPITWSGGSTAGPTTADLKPPTAADILIDPSLSRTNYFAMDPNGLSSPTYSSNRVFEVMPGSSFTANSASGVYFLQSGFVPSGPEDRIIIMSIVPRSASVGSLSTQGILVGLRDFATAQPNGVPGFVRFGAANASNNSGLWGQSYYLDARVIPDTSGGFSQFTQYEISVVAVPAPSGTVAFGLFSVVAAARRRTPDTIRR